MQSKIEICVYISYCHIHKRALKLWLSEIAKWYIACYFLSISLSLFLVCDLSSVVSKKKFCFSSFFRIKVKSKKTLFYSFLLLWFHFTLDAFHSQKIYIYFLKKNEKCYCCCIELYLFPLCVQYQTFTSHTFHISLCIVVCFVPTTIAAIA